MTQQINYKYLDQNEISDLPTEIDITYGKENDRAIDAVPLEEQEIDLDTTGLPIEIEVDNISNLPNEQYALLRRNGFGGSDSSILMGVNPYKTLDDLIKEKATDKLSEEEKAIGQKVAVRKGNDLEPLIIEKTSKFLGVKIIKPIDMYKFTDYPWLKMNFDGVVLPEDAKPFPCEIKVATAYGQKHYNPAKCMFIEGQGFFPIPENVSGHNMSILNKAAHYGIPPYYYTQIQQEMMACDAEYGYLSVLFDKDWIVHTWFIWKDQAVWNDLIIKGYKAWERVEQLRKINGVDLSTESILANVEKEGIEKVENFGK